MSSTETLAPAGTTWQLDPVHSTIGFEVSYLAGTFKGSFRDVSATLTTVDDATTLEGTAKVESIDVKDANLAAHLQSPDFFDAENHPELRFRAEDVELGSGSAIVRGEITIKGITQPLEATGTSGEALTDGFGRERRGVTLSTTVDRTAFGMTWNMPLPTGKQALSHEVTINADLQFVKAE
jgi:polyisoprenoid-binding protein YceI